MKKTALLLAFVAASAFGQVTTYPPQTGSAPAGTVVAPGSLAANQVVCATGSTTNVAGCPPTINPTTGDIAVSAGSGITGNIGVPGAGTFGGGVSAGPSTSSYFADFWNYTGTPGTYNSYWSFINDPTGNFHVWFPGASTGANDLYVLGSTATVTSGLVKASGVPNVLTTAVPGTDYVTPSGSITGTASNVTGVVATANGGTGTASPGGITSGNSTCSLTGTFPNQTLTCNTATSGAAGGRYTYVGTNGPGNEATAIVAAINANPNMELYLEGTIMATFAAGTGPTSIPTTGRIVGLPLTSIIKPYTAGSPIMAFNASQNNIVVDGVTFDCGGSTIGSAFSGCLSVVNSQNVKFDHCAGITSTATTTGSPAIYAKDDQGTVVTHSDFSGGFTHLFSRQISGQTALTEQDEVTFNRFHDNGLNIGTTSQIGGDAVYIWQNGSVGLTQAVGTVSVPVASYTPTVQDQSFITTFVGTTTLTIPTVGNGANQVSGAYAKGWGMRGVIPSSGANGGVTMTVTPATIATATVSSSTTGAGPTFTVSAAMTQQVFTGKGVVFATALGCGIATGIFPITLITSTTFSVAGVTSASSCSGSVTFQDIINGAQTLSYAPGSAFQVYSQDGLTLQGSILTSISANYSVSTADEASVIQVTGAGGITITLPNPASLNNSSSAFGPGGYLSVVNTSSGTVTFTSSATINGNGTPLAAGASTYIYIDGYNWQVTGHNGAYAYGWKPYLSGETLVQGNHAWNIAHTYAGTGPDGNCFHSNEVAGAKFIDNTCGMDPNQATTINRNYSSDYSCVRATNSSDFTIQGNHCYHNGETGIFVEFGSFNGQIEGNTVISSATSGIIANGNYDPELGGQVYAPFGGSITVTGNNVKFPGKVCIQTEGASIISSNFCDGGHGAGILISTSGAKAVNVFVNNNNIIDTSIGGVTNYAGIALAAVANAAGITIADNKITLPAAVIPIIGQTSSSSANPTVLTLPSTATVVTGNTYSFAGLVGNTAPNGNSYVVTVVDQNHISIPVAATGTWTSGGAATAVASVPDVATVNVSGQVISSYLSTFGAFISGETVRDQNIFINQMGTPTAGTRVFISNGTAGACTTAGSGTFGFYRAGAWTCI